MKKEFYCKFIREHRGAFTHKAEHAIWMAEMLSDDLGDHTVNTGHLLWGLADPYTGVTSDLLAEYGVTADKIFAEMVRTYKNPDFDSENGMLMAKEEEYQEKEPRDPEERPPEFSYGLTRAIEDSYEIVSKRAPEGKTEKPGTLHLLVQLLCFDSYAIHIISSLGANDKALASEAVQLLNTNEIMKRKLMFQMDGVELPDADEQQDALALLREITARQQAENGRDGREGAAPPQLSPLRYFGVNMVREASEGRYGPFTGQDDLIRRVIRILMRKTKNSPCIIGESGVGKTALVEGLAARIAEGNVPDAIRNMKIIRLDMSAIIAGTRYRGDFEDRMQPIIDEASADKDIVLFIDDIHTIAGGGADGGGDAAGLLKPGLSSGDLRIIGATTTQDYKRLFEKNTALSHRFQPVPVREPDEAEAEEMLKAVLPSYEKYHGMRFAEGTAEAAVRLSARFISDRALPDKAIDVIDDAATFVRMKEISKSSGKGSVSDGGDSAQESAEGGLRAKANELYRAKIEAVKAGNKELAARLNAEEKMIREKLDGGSAETVTVKGKRSKEKSVIPVVTVEDIERVVSQWSGVPLEKVGESDSEKLLRLEEAIHRRLVGQDEAVSLVSKAVRRGRAGMKDPKRPIGSFMFLGPTGVGKTELARALAENLFGSENNIIRLDMS
ncbi:MAG: ATP-dependent Clp protease ATP-binding subunit, partial [Clostridia bacterium]|nr:ATP-dependent Clp protease ATP-binding subunit [Clostridia bacterium]